jgi:hypothetical protein
VLFHGLRAAALAVALAGCLYALPAAAAGGAFAVDDSEVGAPGECKVEAWGAFADNSNFIGAIAPACVFNLGRPVDVSATVARVRVDDSWNTDLVLKAKTPIIPLGDGSFGVALSGSIGFNLTDRQTAAVLIVVPFTFQVSEPLRVNVNFGVLFDLVDKRNLFAWGAGFEYSLSKPFTFIAEVFGFDRETSAQAGLRYTPHEKVDFDLIYGYNLTGEKANWITLGVNVRF